MSRGIIAVTLDDKTALRTQAAIESVSPGFAGRVQRPQAVLI